MKELIIKFAKMTCKQLREYLKQKGVKGYSKMNKDSLLNLVYDLMIDAEIATITDNVPNQEEVEALKSENKRLHRVLDAMNKKQPIVEKENKQLKEANQKLVAKNRELNNKLMVNAASDSITKDVMYITLKNIGCSIVNDIYDQEVLTDGKHGKLKSQLLKYTKISNIADIGAAFHCVITLFSDELDNLDDEINELNTKASALEDLLAVYQYKYGSLNGSTGGGSIDGLFKNNRDKVKRMLKDCAMMYHPDHGGNIEMMQFINGLREQVKKTI